MTSAHDQNHDRNTYREQGYPNGHPPGLGARHILPPKSACRPQVGKQVILAAVLFRRMRYLILIPDHEQNTDQDRRPQRNIASAPVGDCPTCTDDDSGSGNLTRPNPFNVPWFRFLFVEERRSNRKPRRTETSENA